jgi:hypothetical protein
MANTYVTDLRYFLDDTDNLAEMRGPALNLARVLTSLVVTDGFRGWPQGFDAASLRPIVTLHKIMRHGVAARHAD